MFRPSDAAALDEQATRRGGDLRREDLMNHNSTVNVGIVGLKSGMEFIPILQRVRFSMPVR
jgi:hypothetical protein